MIDKKRILKPISLTLISLIVYASYALAGDVDARLEAIVDITSVPEGAAIIINGRAAGEAPLESITLAAGEYEIKAQMHGLGDTTAEITLAAGGEKDLTIHLGPAGGGSLFWKTTAFTGGFLVGVISGAMIAVLLAIAGGSDPGFR